MWRRRWDIDWSEESEVREHIARWKVAVGPDHTSCVAIAAEHRLKWYAGVYLPGTSLNIAYGRADTIGGAVDAAIERVKAGKLFTFKEPAA